MPTKISSTRKRVLSACLRCRKQKIRCEGTKPCRRCQHRGFDCNFSVDDKKVTISEKDLNNLRNRLKELENANTHSTLQSPGYHTGPVYGGTRSSDAVVETNSQASRDTVPQVFANSAQSNPEEVDDQVITSSSTNAILTIDDSGIGNPLLPWQPAYLTDKTGRLKYLGHSSTFSFSRQVLHMIQQSPHPNPFPFRSMYVEGDTYAVAVDKESSTGTSAIVGLPSLELSLYYLHCLKFKTYPLYHLFDEEGFVRSLREFYNAPTAYAKNFPIWFVHYLVLTAFGKAIITPQQLQGQPSDTDALPGSELFARALRLIPDVTRLCKDPVEATELLCCIALYLQSIDHRTAAHIYIGHALRLAQSHGLHTNIQAEAIGDDLVHRGRHIWWTVYCLDRKFSASQGVPSSLREEEISSPFPFKLAANEDSAAVMTHVKICRLSEQVVSTVYGSAKCQNSALLETIQVVLKNVADLADELKSFSDSCFGEISRVASSLELAYHQCIILCSRPLLFHTWRHQFQNLNRRYEFNLSSAKKGLIQVCVNSALQMITILSNLTAYNLLDTFLPFDLECAFSAAFVLVMAKSIHNRLVPRTDWLEKILKVFDVIASVNTLAAIRKSEVERLAEALLVEQTRQNQTQQDISTVEIDNVQSPTLLANTDRRSLSSIGEPFFDVWSLNDCLSGGQILDLADALTVTDFDHVLFEQNFERQF